jgi:hypothetical protein
MFKNFKIIICIKGYWYYKLLISVIGETKVLNFDITNLSDENDINFLILIDNNETTNENDNLNEFGEGSKNTKESENIKSVQNIKVKFSSTNSIILKNETKRFS